MNSSLLQHLRLIAVGLVAVCSVACGSLEPRQISDGERTYMERCTSCHDAYEPHEYAAPVWRKAVAEMEVDHGVKLTPEEKALILSYVTGTPTPVAAPRVSANEATGHSGTGQL